MDDARWGEIVERLEALATRDPRGYRRRVALLAAAGYAFLLLAVLTLFALGGLVAWLAIAGPAVLFKFLIPLGALLVVVVRASWVRIEPPGGIPLERGTAPALFDLIDEIRRRVDGPDVHAVLVDHDLNAGVVQVPRLGAFGWQRNYLVLGLPLMEALPPDEFAAVLAHEFGHLSGSHGRFGVWIYRIRLTWARLLLTLEEQRRVGTFAFRRFFEWYAPYFNAYSFVLARAQEYEADRDAAAATSGDAAGRALVRLQLAAAYLDQRYWPRVFAGANRQAQPPATAFTGIAREIGNAGGVDRADRWARAALTEPGDPADTHPPLSARLAALAVDPEAAVAAVRERPEESSSERYLGAARERLLAELDEGWRSMVEAGWRERHEEAREERRRLGELNRRGESGATSVDEDFERATLVENLEEGDPVVLLRGVIARSPHHAQASFALGRLLLDRDDESGIGYLETAMSGAGDAVIPACALIAHYLEEHGRRPEAATYRARMDERLGLLIDAEAERDDVRDDDRLEPHGLPFDLVERVVVELRRYEEVARAYLVRKRTRHLDDEHPLYLLVVKPRQGWRRAWREADEDAPTLAGRIAEGLDLPVDLRVVVPGPRSRLEGAVAAVTESLTYEAA